VGAIEELTQEPLTAALLAERYRALCEDPRFADLQAKVEIDERGRIIASPANNSHGILQIQIGIALRQLGGVAIAEASVLTAGGVLVADVAWASDAFMAAHGSETPFSQAPDLCVEIASPSNTRKDLERKMSAYLAAGAREAWIVLPQSRRIEVYTAAGRTDTTTFAIDLDGLLG